MPFALNNAKDSPSKLGLGLATRESGRQALEQYLNDVPINESCDHPAAAGGPRGDNPKRHSPASQLTNNSLQFQLGGDGTMA